MDTKTLKSLQQALSDLQAERRVVDEAIGTLQGLLGGRSAARGRAAPARATSGRQRRKPRWTRAMREAARERMRKYWEQRNKGSKG